MEQRGQATACIAILALVVGIVAFAIIYGMNSRQNAELANRITERITISEPVIEDVYMESLEHAAKRHGPIVYAAYARFLEGSWWVTVEGAEVEGDNIVTVFPRKSVQVLHG